MVTQGAETMIWTGSGHLIDVIPYVLCLYWIVLNSRGSLPALYSREGRVTSRFRPRSIWLYGKYLQGIRYLSYLNRSSFIAKISSDCLAVHADQCQAPYALILWAGPPLAVRPMFIAMGTWGYTPHSIPKIFFINIFACFLMCTRPKCNA